MDRNNVYRLVLSLSAIERRDARRFLESPYFNLRTDLIRLFDFFCSDKKADKACAWATLHPAEPYDDTRMRLLMSYLNRLLETFLLVQDMHEKAPESRIRLAAAYRNRGLMEPYERTMRAFERDLNTQPCRNENYYALQRLYCFEQHETALRKNPAEPAPLRDLAHSTDAHYLTARLRLICLELSQKNVYRSDSEAVLHRTVVALAEVPEWAGQPGISTYLSAIRMLQHGEDSAHYHDFLKKMEDGKALFSEVEQREFFLFAINHCIRRANSGAREMESELLDLYRRALESGSLFENGVLSRFTYHNIVATSLRCGEPDWAEEFVRRYNGHLERQYRESALNFNLARVDYARHHFDSVLTLLQKANYADPLLHLAAKTLLLKTYFVLDEHDLLHSHLDAMRNYIHRKKVLGYHRKNYLNIIRFTERILQRGHERKHRDTLRKEIEEEPVLTEKEWLLEQLA
ncbi:MAG: hypothetical protein ACKVU2_06035 [Saprospiraceae bacterium]